MDESEGPNLLDCPVRMVHRANRSPIQDERAARWREKVLEQHEKKSRARKFLQELKDTFPDCDRRIIVGDREARYRPTTHRGKKIHTYQLLQDSVLYRLRPLGLNMERTLELRETPTVK